MKLRSLTLENVRRFGGQRAHLDGIGDGLTVVAQANEFGKSTFFDALHALFFLRHASSAAAVKSLQPHAGGPVVISAEVELPEGRFALTKTYLQRKSAQVTRLPEHTVIARGGEADDWIEGMLARMAGGAGPTGLLWVRQGVTGFEPQDRDQASARRDLLSSVAGEIETMTGGRGMDRILHRAEAALAEIATQQQGRPKGPRKEVEDALSAARSELEAVSRDCSDLRDALGDRARARAELARLSDPEVAARQAQALREAEARHAAAEAHSRQIETALTALEVARLEESAARQAQARQEALVAELDAAEADLLVAETALRDAEQDKTEALDRMAEAKAAQSAAEATQETLRAERDRAQAATLQARAAEEVARLTEVLAQVDAHLAQARREAALAADHPATPERLRAVEDAEAARAQAQALLAAGAVTLRVVHDGPARVTRDGAPLPDGEPVALAEDTALHLPGLGRMEITVPGTETRDRAADLARAEAGLQAALTQCGAASVSQARQAATARGDHLSRAAMARKLAETLAPKGREALAQQLEAAQLQVAAGAQPPSRPIAEIAPELERAQAQLQAARAKAEATRDRAAAAQAAVSGAVASRSAAMARCAAARAAAGSDADRQHAQDAAAARLAETLRNRQEAETVLQVLRQSAPDPETTAANLTRARTTLENTRARIIALERDLAALEERIGARAERGVEERAAELTGEVAALEQRAAAYAEEVAALNLLIESLSKARSAARDVYFEPVQQEIRPLLSLLHGSADLHWQDEAVLPGALDREGQQEAYETLSGGTQEQIAILTRLAFARLYARRGTHVPVILDDALVYSDDDRIVQMFTALTRVAMEQQVIVFSCRQRAFEELGGARPRIEITPLA